MALDYLGVQLGQRDVRAALGCRREYGIKVGKSPGTYDGGQKSPFAESGCRYNDVVSGMKGTSRYARQHESAACIGSC